MQGALRVDGKLEGSVDNARHVVVGENGHVVGNLTAKTIILSGLVEGDVCADNVQIFSSAKVQGDIRAKVLTVEGGAAIKGKLEVENAASEEKDEK